ncbi:MAG: hypothetical protein K5893_10000 [Prevotella sp.]|nr:hypothetical protein [Prevotella sp.]
MTENSQIQPSYNTLRSIADRKAQLLKEIRKDSDQITKLRRQLFEKPTALTSKRKGARMQGLMTTGAGLFDAVVLVWKLYRKFKK